MSDDSLLKDLTPPQQEAVTHVDGPLLVLAGPGSGKTRVITRRIAHLVLRVGIAPWNVLAITFTNKAASEMRQRVAQMLSERQARAVTVCTFHSFCARTLRMHGSLVGLSPGYSIYDSSDQERAVKQAIADLQLSTSNFSPGRMLGSISQAKNDLMDAQAFSQDARDFMGRQVARIYARYEEILQKNNALDFDDLLLKTVQLMRQHSSALAELRQRYQYLLIDEYQDTNHAQFVIAHALASGDSSRQNICATGDPDQSIYSWRGADLQNILDFEEHYPNARVVRLEQNYRSTKHILAVADGLIRHNQHRKHKSLWTENEQGELVGVTALLDERHEARWIVNQFQAFQADGAFDWGQMAILYRINSLSRVMEESLRRAGVPYQIARGTAFYERAEVKDALAYLRVLANPADEVNLLRIINKPARGISDATVKAMQAQAVAAGVGVADWMRQVSKATTLNKRAVAAVEKFSLLLESWQQAALMPEPAPSLRDWVQQVLQESGLWEHYRSDPSDPDQERLANLGELISSAQQFEQDYQTLALEQGLAMTPLAKLRAYLEQVSLVSDVDAVTAGQGAVTLMTLHAAKGLEFPVVAMLGLEESILPHQRANSNPRDMEEERRLCFVGMTRSMKRLMLTYARSRTMMGQTMPTIPSRFLGQLPEDHLKVSDLSLLGFSDRPSDDSAALTGRRLEPVADDSGDGAAGLTVGMRVRHPSFGVGRVLRVTGKDAQARVQVHFATSGIKTLILAYAKLQPA